MACSSKEPRDWPGFCGATSGGFLLIGQRLPFRRGLCWVLPVNLKDLRGAPPGQPDLIADYTSEFLKGIEAAEKLLKIYTRIKVSYTLFLATVAIGLGGLLVAFLFETTRQYVSITCYVVIAFQLLLVLIIRRWMGRFEECERMS